MKNIPYFLIITLILFQFGCSAVNTPTKNSSMDKQLTYLALGDSYTIGEGVDVADRYPNQAIKILSNDKLLFDNPKIIAKTGWTTDELAKGIKDASIEGQTFDLVTLLIGVNNQYRGRTIDNYREEFTDLLQKAIQFAKGDKNHVVVISIPDWGVTPFAADKSADKDKVAQEIDLYNQAKKAICNEIGIAYIDITEHYRIHGMKPESVVSDNLHPSGMIYRHWAEGLVEVVRGMEF
ncbi:SGNH/GDSL hydrolase family protein [Belliella sp. R4-6]|uniref:SGNH/GDSL hydrolase family protein n=1 Tax=Belliella alkalica TaxID=1730871 RepID=A0ABS9V816_9BACT|nr:SGNH/GDSL hydrolase family protein [Belliella alkalica]MCH7412549.1 SGNH/GDSL hydrolase family protein [Belliella alkalica]